VWAWKDIVDIDRQNWSTGATCARLEKPKKEPKQWQTWYSPRPPTSSDRDIVWPGRWSLGDSSEFQV